MAQIKDLKLTVEKGSMASKAKLKANFTVVFTPAEKKLNLHFGLFIMLYEVDFRPDILIPLPNGFNAMRFANLDASMNGTKNTQDDAIGWTKSGIIVPNGKSQLEIELSEEVRLINRNVTNESFRAGVYVSPEISAGFAWSDEVVIPCDTSKPIPVESNPKTAPVDQTYTNNAIQAAVNKTAPSGTTKKTVVKKVVKPKAPAKPMVKKAVVKKTIIKKVVAEKNTTNSVKQESVPSPVAKKPVAKTVVKKVVAEKNVSNSIKQESVPSPVAKKAPAVKKKVTKTTIKSTSSRKPAAKKSTPNVAQQAPMANKEVTKPATKPDETSSPTDQKSSPKT